jgi:hypothetical protein
LAACAAGAATADDAIFDIQEIAAEGRVISADFGDFNGDGRIDLMLVRLDGPPAEELRTLSVFAQQTDGRFLAEPSYTMPVPEWSAVYDIADLRDTPGDELILLRPDRVSILSVASMPAAQWDLPIEGPSTFGAADDERGFDRFRLVYNDFGDDAWILVPQIGMMSAISAEGVLLSQFEVCRRANFFVGRDSGILSTESDLQLYLDAPKVTVGDVDGDGRSDLVAATRHEIRVFLQSTDGRFARHADRTIPLTYLSERDHSRGSGSVVSTLRDINGDRRLDLMISHTEGSFSNASSHTRVFFNRDGRWNIETPDDEFVDKGAWSSDVLVDLDSSGRNALVRVMFKFSVLELIELLVTQQVDSRLAIYRIESDGRFGPKAWATKKISVGLSFDTFRLKGFVPPAGIDLNADGYMDLILSADGKAIDVYLGGPERPYARRSATQRLPSSGVIRFADFNNDGLPDFLLFDPQVFDSTIKIGRNRGKLAASQSAATGDF